MCRSRIDHPIGNFAIRFQGETLPPKPVDEALRSPSFRLYTLSGDCPEDLNKRLLGIGMKLRYQLSGMSVGTTRHRGENDLVSASTAADALDVARFITATFFWRSTRTVREQLASIMAASYPNHEFYAVRDKRGIIAAGTLTLDAEVIGLYNLCVRPDVRSQGVGTSVFTELGRIASARASHVVLTCDPDLVPWYAHRGCTVAGSLEAFSA